MPLARIDLIAGKPEDDRRTVGDVVYQAMAEIPVSGVSGDSGGSVATIYYDSQGHAHFEN